MEGAAAANSQTKKKKGKAGKKKQAEDDNDDDGDEIVDKYGLDGYDDEGNTGMFEFIPSLPTVQKKPQYSLPLGYYSSLSCKLKPF